MNRVDLSNVEDRIFGKILRRQAEEAGDSPFLVTDDATVTFAQAEEITNRLAAGLGKLGIASGDRVALFLGNRPEMVLLALAINKLAAIWVPINTDYKGEWLLDTLQRSRCKLLVTEEALQSRIGELAGRLEIEQLVLIGDVTRSPLKGAEGYDGLLDAGTLTPDYAAMHYGDTCAIVWTSGTTGRAKGVMQPYNAWIRAILGGMREQYGCREGDVIYCVLPLYNAAAWITSIFRALLEGIPCVIEQKFSVSTFWERIEHFQATQTFAIGAMGVFLMNAPARPEDATTPLRVAQVVPLPPQMWKPFEQRFGVRLVRTGLGQSECLMVLNQTEDRDDVPVYALGFPQPDADIALLDEDGREVPEGEPGEICVKPLAPHVLFNGYFDDPDATAAAYHGEWYRTGDMGRRDPANGAYFFVDRMRDAVRFAGRNISTLEVESVVRRHPAVQDVAAFGIPCEELESEDELKIDIVLREGHRPSHEEICAFINENAPHYFVPRYMEFVNSLPYTPTNKVQKFKLREAGLSPSTWDLKQSTYRVEH